MPRFNERASCVLPKRNPARTPPNGRNEADGIKSTGPGLRYFLDPTTEQM